MSKKYPRSHIAKIIFIGAKFFLARITFICGNLTQCYKSNYHTSISNSRIFNSFVSPTIIIQVDFNKSACLLNINNLLFDKKGSFILVYLSFHLDCCSCNGMKVCMLIILIIVLYILNYICL